MIKFSIILFTYNRPQLVVETIGSLLNQTYKNFEVFLFDNGSLDSIEKIVLPLIDERFYFSRFESNIVGCDIAEEVLNKATGDFFCVLADDDAFLPNTLEKINEAILRNESVDVIGTGILEFNRIKRHHLKAIKMFI